MKQGKYTAIEVLVAAGIEKPEEKIGKLRVRIAGIAGIVKADHIVKLGSGKIEVIVGNESYELELEALENDEKSIISDGARKALNDFGEEVKKKNEALKKAKEEVKKKVEVEDQPVDTQAQ